MDIGSDKAVAARMAREAAERARRVEIMNKIHELEKEKEKCESLRAGFEGKRGKVGALVAQMSGIKSMNLQPDKSVFSGNTAGAVGFGVLNAQMCMGKSCNQFSDLEAAVGTQVEKLNAYIKELEDKIDNLRAGL